LVDSTEYHKVVQQVILFMEGKTDRVVEDLRQKMFLAAENLEFERAAALRDQVRNIQKVMEERQIKVASNPNQDMDAIAMAHGRDEDWVEVFFIRQGKLIGRDHFIMEGTQDDPPGHIMAEFIKQFYQSAAVVPRRIIVQHDLEEEGELILQWLRDKRGGAVALVRPQRGDQRKLINMVAENALQGLTQSRARWLSDADAVQEGIGDLQEALNLPVAPRRIECYDISNIQGTNSVGSMVVSEDGFPKPAHYRRFRIKDVEGIDDYAMMQEVLRRRFKRLASIKGKGSAEGDGRKLPQLPSSPVDPSWGIVPDLVLIDGGKGHLSAALEVFLELGIDFIPLASLAKENEWLFVPQTPEPIVLPRTSQALHLVQRIRDEAHRFAITYHRKLRSKRSITSSVDLVPGIGPKRKRLLMRRFGSVKGIKEAGVEDIAAIPGMTRSLAVRLKESL
jgi:excinuclease ABC subunit C